MIRSTTVFGALLLALPASGVLAQGPGEHPMAAMAMAAPHGPIVNLSVTESVDAAPDMATIQTGVETRAPSAKAAMAQNAAQIDAVIKALLAAGIARRDVQTSGINLSPQYDYSNRTNGEGPKFIGYQANNNLTVTLRKLDKAGDIIDTMVNAGATNINGPSLGIADTDALEAAARAKAIKTAQDRAAAYAKAAGYASARLLEISEMGVPPRPVPMLAMRAEALASAPATKIEPGQLSTSITLQFRYMLER